MMTSTKDLFVFFFFSFSVENEKRYIQKIRSNTLLYVFFLYPLFHFQCKKRKEKKQMLFPCCFQHTIQNEHDARCF